MINFSVITIFPEMFSSYLSESMLERAQKRGKISVTFYNPRDFTTDVHHTIDDRPYGGGPGMVMRAEPIIKAVARAKGKKRKVKIIILSPGGTQFSNEYADSVLNEYTNIILIAGRYEGIDARVKEVVGAEEVSVGPYTLTGGELPAMIIIDAMTRRLDGVLGNELSIEERRVASRKVYTRPDVLVYKGKKYSAPEVLRSGHHKDIESWREKE